MKKKLMSIILSIGMIVMMFPSGAFAAGEIPSSDDVSEPKAVQEASPQQENADSAEIADDSDTMTDPAVTEPETESETGTEPDSADVIEAAQDPANPSDSTASDKPKNEDKKGGSAVLKNILKSPSLKADGHKDLYGTDIPVTDEALSSASNMTDNFDNAVITIDGQQFEDTDTWNVVAGEKYKAVLQFNDYYDSDNNDHVLIDREGLNKYPLPGGLNVSNFDNKLKITVTDNLGECDILDNPWGVYKGVLYFQCNSNDPNYERLVKCQNLQVWFDMNLGFDSDLENIPWKNGKNTKINVESANLSIEKEGKYDPEDGKVHYTIRINSVGAHSNVVVEDLITPEGIAEYDKGSLKVSSNIADKVSYESGSSTFPVTIASMSDKETVTLKYSASVKASAFSDDENGVIDNKARVKSDMVTEWIQAEASVTLPQSELQKTAVASDEIVKGKRTVAYTVTVNPNALAVMNGDVLTDTLSGSGADKANYSGKGITISKYDRKGVFRGSEKAVWADILSPDGKSWSYTLSDTKPYKYVIDYTAQVDISSADEALTLNNTVTDSYDKAETSTQIKADSEVEISKKVITSANQLTSWEIQVTVPKEGIKDLKVTDYIPSGKNSGGSVVYDEFVRAIVKGLGSGESYSQNKNGSESVTFEFSELAPSDSKRIISIIVTTAFNPTIVGDHVNKTSAEWSNGKKVSAEAKTSGPVSDYIRKSLDQETAGETDSEGLPTYRYTVFFSLPKSFPYTIEDSFDTDLFEIDGDVTIGAINDPTGDITAENVITDPKKFTPEPTSDGASITFDSRMDLPQQNNGYCHRMTYTLKVKDKEALKELQLRAARGNGTYTINNTVSVKGNEDLSSSCSDATFEYVKDLSKELTYATTDDRRVNYEMTVNEDGLDLDPYSDTITITDVPQGIVIADESIKAQPADALISKSVDGNNINLVLKDETPITITYFAFKENGTKTGVESISNKVRGSWSGRNEIAEDSAEHWTAGGGTAYQFGVNIHKYDDEEGWNKPLKGAKYHLYRFRDGVKEQQYYFGDITRPVILETGEDGNADYAPGMLTDGFGFIVGVQYCLQEFEAPEGYAVDPTPVYFMFPSKEMDIDIDNGIYLPLMASIGVSNKPAGTIVLNKSFEGDIDKLPSKYKNGITFTITGTNGYEKEISYSDFTDGKYVLNDVAFGESYTVKESNTAIDGYEVTTEIKVGNEDGNTVVLEEGSGEQTVNITNSYKKIPAEISGTKIWIDGDGDNRPDEITIRVIGTVNNGSDEVINIVKTIRLTGEESEDVIIAKKDGDGNWTFKVKGLEKFYEGSEIVYKITEEAIDGYVSKVEGDAENGFKITNTELTEASVKKVWDDADDKDGIRPEELKVTLSNGTEDVAEETLSEDNDWSATVKDLPKYDSNGDAVEYTWTEKELPEGYELTDTSVEGTVTTLTNTHVPDKVVPVSASCEVRISKVSEKGKAISGAVFEVYRFEDGKEVKLTQSDYGWLDANGQFTVGKQPYLLSDLEDGRYEIKEVKAPEGYKIKDKWPVTFTVRDGQVDGSLNTLTSGVKYEKTGDGSALYTITNTSIPGKGVKTGDDTNIGLWLTLLLLTAGCLAGMLVYRRRKA